MLVGSERIHSSRLAGLKGLEEGQVDVQGDGFIAQSKAEIADQSLGHVILGILFQHFPSAAMVFLAPATISDRVAGTGTWS